MTAFPVFPAIPVAKQQPFQDLGFDRVGAVFLFTLFITFQVLTFRVDFRNKSQVFSVGRPQDTGSLEATGVNR